MRSTFPLAALVLALAAAGTQCETPQAVNLADLQGWDIVAASDAPPAVRYAAEELQAHLEKATGLRTPIVTESARPDRHFFVGASEALRASNVAVETAGFGPEDSRVVVRDGNVAVVGGAPRGTLYAVYSFLEDPLGIRFLTADHTRVPSAETWKQVGPVDRCEHPRFAMRWSYYGEVNRNPAFAARLRVNTVTHEEKLGGATGITNVSHSFYRQLPSQTYGKEHPEYYALVGGRRRAPADNDAVENQPCLTNPDVLRLVTAAVLAEIDHHPQAENVSVCQNDDDRYCRCERCAAIDAREGTPMGSLLAFVNAVADEVAKTHPQVKVGTLSYWYSRTPPRELRPRPNVQIQLCSIECCQIHAIDDPDCPLNAAFCRDLEAWGKICPNVSIWTYATDFSDYLLPCPNLRTLERNVRFFAAHGATGMFFQAAGNASGAELSELRNYVMANLLRDPSRSGDALIDEFLAQHYGKAAPCLRRYVDLIHDAATAAGIHRNCFAGRAVDYGLDETTAERAIALFDEAEAAIGDDVELRARVERASIGAYRLALDSVWTIADAKGLSEESLARLRPRIGRFLERCEHSGVDRASENAEFAPLAERLRRIAR